MNNRLKYGKIFLSSILLPFFSLLCFFQSIAQDTLKVKKPLIRFREWQYALGANLGSKGAGADIAFRISPHWHLRGELNYLQGSLGRHQFDFGSFGLSDNAWLFRGKIRQHSAEILVDYAVLHEQLRLVAGIAIHPINRIEGIFTLKDSVQFNEVRIAPEEMGQIDASLYYSRFVSPYLGMGLGRVVPWRRLSLGLDAGAYFRGSPRTQLLATGLLKTNENNQAQLQSNLRNKSIWPVMNLRLGLRFL